MPKPRTPKGRAVETVHRLAELYPGTARDLCELDFDTPFQLLVATVLSAQTTDERVNSVTPTLFKRYPTAGDLAAADPAEVEDIIRTTGFFRSKARSLIGLGQALDQRFGGEVPTGIEDLVTLPGVGRKTANVIRGVAFGLPGLAVDTHVTRIARLLGLTHSTDPVQIEKDVCALIPAKDWASFGLTVILHGRRTCNARRPLCEECVLSDFCPSAGLPAITKQAAARQAAARKAGAGAGVTRAGTAGTASAPSAAKKAARAGAKSAGKAPAKLSGRGRG